MIREGRAIELDERERELAERIGERLQQAGFHLEACERFYMKGWPRSHTYTFRGVARKA